MFRIRFHGRGGQGLKTASRILGNAFFSAGYQVQDAPRYGAERRGAPIFAYVRADKESIKERGIIQHPSLVIVIDESLISLTAAGVLQGLDQTTTLLFYSDTDSKTWQNRLGINNSIITLPTHTLTQNQQNAYYIGVICASAAAQLCGVISEQQLTQAIQLELQNREESIIQENIRFALDAFRELKKYHATVKPVATESAKNLNLPEWIDLPFEAAQFSAPAIHASNSSQLAPTGLWRTLRPVIEYDRCHRCWWVCSTYCPDSAINVTNNNYPQIDYDHCKGCMVCVAQCPSHAIIAINESDANKQEIMEPPA